nr:retrovirus-related Pol polyprotein from transposon TNT 1-94 [Tanacetum cinerariifolium]
MDLQDQGVIDSGCSRHMTGNMSYLTDYKEIDGGYVSFRGRPKGGKITRKCTIKIATKDETSGIVKSFINRIENIVDHKFKAEAVSTACYVQNRVLVEKPHNKTSYELFHGRTLTLSFIRPFGCPVTILNTIDHLGKFDGKANAGFFIKYYLNSKAFRVFNSKTRIVEENLHIRFSESTPNVVGSRPGTKASDNACQARKETEPVKNYILLSLWTADPPFSQDPMSSHDDGSKPASDDRKKVDEDPRKNSTINAAGINEVNAVGGKISIELLLDPKMSALEDDSIFDFLSDDEDDGAVADMNNLDTTIQVFRNKKNERGIVIINKASLVAQAYTQEEWIDHDEVFAPVARIEAIRLFLAYALFKDFFVYQMDVKSAFLYGRIKEEVHVCQPPRFEDPNFLDRVYKVEKALSYALHLREVKTASTLMETQKPLLKDEDGEEVDVHMYRSMIGSLMYLTSLRPNIMFAVCACARYQVKLKVSHLHAVKRSFSDYAGASLDMKSTIGGCQFLRCRLILWQCKKQIVVANSTTEAEYMAASSCCRQVFWIQNQLLDYRVLDLEKTTTTQRNEIASLKRRVKKLEKKNRSRTHRMKRLYKVGLTTMVEPSDNEESLVSVQDEIVSNDADKEMFDADVLDGEEVFVAKHKVTVKGLNDEVNVVEEVVEVINTAKLIIDAAQDSATGDIVSTASVATTVSAATTTTARITIVEQRLDEEVALKLQATFDEEEKLAREKAKKVEEANIALIETWNDIQEKIDADHQLAERMQAQEQEELSIAEKATLFQQLFKKRRKHFAAKSAEEKRNKPPTKAQQRKIMCTYLKNLEGY